MNINLSPIFIIIATILAIFFPAKLIDAIRNPNEEKSQDSEMKACFMFGAIVLIILLMINS